MRNHMLRAVSGELYFPRWDMDNGDLDIWTFTDRDGDNLGVIVPNDPAFTGKWLQTGITAVRQSPTQDVSAAGQGSITLDDLTEADPGIEFGADIIGYEWSVGLIANAYLKSDDSSAPLEFNRAYFSIWSEGSQAGSADRVREVYLQFDDPFFGTETGSFNFSTPPSQITRLWAILQVEHRDADSYCSTQIQNFWLKPIKA